MGYAKQLIEVAARWLRANPDPKSPFLKVPGFDKNRDHPDGLTAAQLLRYDVIAKQRPDVAPYIAELKELDRQVLEQRAALHEHEAEFESRLSAPSPGQDKYTVRDDHVLIGRWCLAWARSGYNVFDLSPDFVAAMLLTDARELDVDLVRLPFPAILITMPGGFAIGAEGSSYTKIHVTEISANDLHMLHTGDRVMDRLKHLAPEEARAVIAKARTQAPLPMPLAEQIGTARELIEQRAPRASAKLGALHIYATDGMSVLDTLIDRDGLTWDSFDDLPDHVTHDADKRARQTLRQIVFGMLAYTNAIDRAVELRFTEPRKKKAVASDKLRATQWAVGRTVKIDPVLVRLAQSGNRETVFRLKHKFIVRGHYRNQAHGPQHSLRTSRWIAPFWKGPEDGAALVHTYKLGDPTP